MSLLFDEATSGATVSECGLYRYHLWRCWNEDLPVMVFVMLNPSVADAVKDDPTIRRCIAFAKRERYGGISVRNLFAFRATDPDELLTATDPHGPDNYNHLLACRRSFLMTRLVAAWGNVSPKLRQAAQSAINVVSMNDPYCLGTTKDGNPRHPLYVKGDAPIVPWRAT